MDPILSPPAPSGKLDIGTKHVKGDNQRVLPAGTRMYVDAGGGKNYITPDGESFFVPPDELPNFIIEGEDADIAMRRAIIDIVGPTQAAQAMGLIDNAFVYLEQLRRMGVNFDVHLPEKDIERYPALAKALDARNGAEDIDEYPKAMYHRDGSFKVVNDADEEGDAGEGWQTTQPDQAAPTRFNQNGTTPLVPGEPLEPSLANGNLHPSTGGQLPTGAPSAPVATDAPVSTPAPNTIPVPVA